MIFLDQFAKGRDNNFNLIRAVAAVAVLVSHAYPIALGAKAVQPLEAALGHSLGAIAVFVFFVLSGYLISASFERSASPKAFWQARILRLAPCLVVSLGLVGLVMGPMVSSLPVTEYLAHPDTWSFLARNLTLALPQYELPGVFEANPYRTVEGSIWTLFHEVACYGMVFALGLAGVLRKARLMAGFLLAYAVAWGLTAALPVDLPTKAEQFRMMSFPFVVGMAFYVWRARLALSIWIVLALAGLAALLRGTPAFTPALVLALGYATFWCAFVPGGWLRAYNRLGDYSYGLYLYAFPVQGLVVWLWGPMGPALNVALALPLTLFLSVLSWHLIEAPALALRKAPARLERPGLAL